MKKATLAIAAALFTGSIALSFSASAASILFDEASTLPLTAVAHEESNSPKVTFSGFNGGIFSPFTVARAETKGNLPQNLGLMSLAGSYDAGATNAANLGGIGTIKTFNFNFYEDSSFTTLSDTLSITLTRGLSNNIAVSATFLSDSLTGYLPTLLTGATNISETGLVQTPFDQYGLQVSFRSDVPVPAALFFVAPALAGAFGFSRRKPAKAELA